MSSSSASSARRARSPRSCSGPDAPITRSAASRRRGFSRCRATSSWSARRCSTRCGAASSTALRFRRSRWTSLRSRSWPKWRRREWSEDALFGVFTRAYPYATLDARRVSRRRAHGRRGLQHAPRPSRGVRASRCRERGAARPARRAAHRAHLGRRDSRHRRLRRRARARGPARRHRQRGFRNREPGRGHLSARQHVVSNPAGRGRTHTRRRRAGPAPHHSLLAR